MLQQKTQYGERSTEQTGKPSPAQFQQLRHAWIGRNLVEYSQVGLIVQQKPTSETRRENQ